MNKKLTDVFEELETVSFRDSLSTVDKTGGRIWLYPKNSKGKFTNWRTLVAWTLVALMVSGPFVKINGEPLLLLNVLERKFILFGKIFWPQDFHIFLLVMIAFVIFVALFTIVYGRVFCGWVCPQTIFLEFFFRKIEYIIEGNSASRILLDKAPMSGSKFFKKFLKHCIFFIVSFFIANLLLSYMVGADQVWDLYVLHPSSQLKSIAALLIFTSIFYWVFSSFREQVCTTVCPYGRLQGVLLDKNSLMVAYDYVRGEKRAKFRKGESRTDVGKGDCIDCHQCVKACPMGIDIRNGTQLECINCTACMDACDFMMKSVGLPERLIRMDSEAGIAERKPFSFTPKVIGYSMVLIILIGFIFSMLVFRSDIETSMLRTPGVLFQQLPDHKVSNLYNIKIINKTNKEVKVKLKELSGMAELRLVGSDIVVPPQGTADNAAFLIMNAANLYKIKTELKIGVYAEGKQLETLTTTFVGPLNN